MKDIRLNEKKYDDMRKYRNVPAASLAFIILGVIVLVLGIIYYRSSDMGKYYKTKNISETFAAGSVRDINVDFAYGNVTFEESTDGQVHVEGQDVPEELEVGLKGSRLEIIQKKDGKFKLTDFDFNAMKDGRSPKLTVSLPGGEYGELILDAAAGDVRIIGLNIKKLDVDAAAGDVEIGSCTFGSAEIDLAAGDLDCTGLTADGIVDIDNGAGDIDITESTVGGLNIDSGAGDVDYHGTVNGNVDIDCGTGSVKLTLNNAKSDFDGKYDMKISIGIGEKEIEYLG